MHRYTLPLIAAALASTGCAVEPLTLENDVTYVAEWIGTTRSSGAPRFR